VIQFYLDLLADPERIEAFDRVIGEAVRPHDAVVDLVCGVG
jgi:predicted RNA methylase